MIEFKTGNLLEADVEALVNTVNTKGVMGKGVALQFKQAFPANYEAYRHACVRGDVDIGRVFIFRTGYLQNPRWIINVPTKRDWKQPSRIEYVRRGVEALIDTLRTYDIKSVAIPPLGAGSGGLDWNSVKSIIIEALHQLPNVRAWVYEPSGTPQPRSMRVGTKVPNITPTRAALLGLLHRYMVPGYRLARVEIQKLAYFLQAAGEPMKLKFKKGQYGPYSETLNFVLQRLEGHYIRGYGDRSQASPIELIEPALTDAEEVLEARLETRKRLDSVSRLIEGFETPYGLELLASVHWVASAENSMARTSPDIAIELVHSWSKRKAKQFQSDHIRRAWQRLHVEGWLN